MKRMDGVIKDKVVLCGRFQISGGKRLQVPLFMSKISAGFPSPADDYLDGKLDLNEFLIKHPSATFFLRVSGDSMTGAGIFSGDILVVDRAEEAKHDSIVIAELNGELTVKRLVRDNGMLYLFPENPAYQPIKVCRDMEFTVWGVVIHVIHSLYNPARI